MSDPRTRFTVVDDLIADFAAVWPDRAKFHEVHRAQRDAIAEQVFILGLPARQEP